jgi:hypothetical protein
MAGKIFYRERRIVKEGEKKPKYRIVAVSGADLKVYASHLRLSELEHIAKEVGASLIELQTGPKHQKKDQQ